MSSTAVGEVMESIHTKARKRFSDAASLMQVIEVERV